MLLKFTNVKDIIWLSKHVTLEITDQPTANATIYEVANEKNISFYNLDYQNTVDKKIKSQLKGESYTIDSPLLILNPYGTNTLSINAYFDTEEASYVTYTISTESDSDFTRTLNNGNENNLTKNHNYQIVGLVPGTENTITLTLYDENDTQISSKSFTITMPKLSSGVDTHIANIIDGESEAPLSEGLFVMLGHDKAYNSNIYMYDNDGVLRSEIPLIDYRTDRMETIGDDILFSYSDHDLARMNRLGKIVQKYKFSDYVMHHDFVYDETTNKSFILVSEKNTGVVEDVVIAVDMKTGEVEKLLDFKDIFPEVYETAISNHTGAAELILEQMDLKPEDIFPEDMVYQLLSIDETIDYLKEINILEEDDTLDTATLSEIPEELDWIHFNTIQCINGTDLIFSARELSTIIRVNNVFEDPTVKYLISDSSVWEGTPYSDLVYTKVGDFVSQAGQHTVTYIEDDSLEEGQYYLSMFNNNFAGASSRPNYDWTNYPGAGSFSKGDNSYYYKYLVDESQQTYTLVNSFPLPYSSIVSSVEDIENNYMISSGMSKTYCEYDSNGTLIRRYNYDASKYSYRVFKYTFNNFWFK